VCREVLERDAINDKAFFGFLIAWVKFCYQDSRSLPKLLFQLSHKKVLMLINIDLDQFNFNLYLVVVGSHKLLLQRPKEGEQTFLFVGIGLGREQSSDQEDDSAPRNQVKDHD